MYFREFDGEQCCKENKFAGYYEVNLIKILNTYDSFISVFGYEITIVNFLHANANSTVEDTLHSKIYF